MALSFPTKCWEQVCATVKAESFVPHPRASRCSEGNGAVQHCVGRMAAMRETRSERYTRYTGEWVIHLAFMFGGARLAGRRAMIPNPTGASMYAWTVNGTYIPELVNAKADGWIYGTAHRSNQQVFWKAQAQPQGYYVVVTEHTGRETSGHPGGTYNLCLEVAAQIQRAIP